MTQASAQTPQRSQQRFRGVVAGFLSAGVPGLGQAVNGSLLAALTWFVISIGTLTMFTLLRAWQTPAGLYGSAVMSLAIWVAASAHAAWGRRQQTPKALIIVFAAVSVLFVWVALGMAWGLTGFRPFQIPGGSMKPTVSEGDHIIADMWYYKRHRLSDGDPVIISEGKTFWVKRIAALPGETIQGKDGSVYRNGTILQEAYAHHYRRGEVVAEANDFGPVTVPPGYCFLLGDNRDNSYDSRFPEFGLKHISEIVGKPLYVYRNPESPDRRNLSIN